MLSMATRTCSTWWICRRVSAAPVRLMANWATAAASSAVSTVSDTLEMTAAAQLGATIVIPPKTSANVISPTRMTKEEARQKLREKNILLTGLSFGTNGTDYSLPGFLCG